jgi:hypothetical protein
LLAEGGRINVTLRRVTASNTSSASGNLGGAE